MPSCHANKSDNRYSRLHVRMRACFLQMVFANQILILLQIFTFFLTVHSIFGPEIMQGSQLFKAKSILFSTQRCAKNCKVGTHLQRVRMRTCLPCLGLLATPRHHSFFLALLFAKSRGRQKRKPILALFYFYDKQD